MYRIARASLLPFARTKIAAIHGLAYVTSPAILVALHTSWLDPLYIAAAFHATIQARLLFLAANSNYTWTGAVIPIDSENGHALDVAAQHLSAGESVCIFPFGDTPDGRPKTGAVRLARRTGVPILPVRLDNVLSADSHHGITSFFRQSNNIEITFLPPVQLPHNTGTPEGLHQDTEHIISLLRT